MDEKEGNIFWGRFVTEKFVAQGGMDFGGERWGKIDANSARDRLFMGD